MVGSASARNPELARSRETLGAWLVIAVAAALVYSNTFDASFHFDDIQNIVQNDALRDPSRLWPPSGGRYLGYLSFALNYRVGGLEVFGYHLANLGIHVCNGLLVFWLTALTLRTPGMRNADAGPLVRRYAPLAAGLLFSVHPLATQSVTYIVQRFASLAALFYLLSVALYVQARLSLEAERPSKGRSAAFYCLSLLAAAGAMRTKEISFTLPLVAAGYELLFFRPGRRSLLLVPLAATALLVPLGLATQGQGLADVLADVSGFASETREISRWAYLLTQSRVVLTYLRLLILPVGQNLDHDFPISTSLGDPAVLVALALLLGIAGAAVSLLVRARRSNGAPGALVFFGVAWFFVTVSVESSIIPIRDVIFEHRAYLPSAGAAVAMGTAVLWMIERLRFRASVAVQATLALLVTAGPLGAAAYARNLVWKNDLTLWSDVVAKSPLKSGPHLALGLAYKESGRVDDAVREYGEAIRLAPDWAEARSDLGLTYFEQGRIDDSIRELGEAIRLAPGLAGAHSNLGLAFFARGQVDEAMREYREAVRLAPGMAEAHSNLGAAHSRKGQLDEAVAEFREAIRLAPEWAQPHFALSRLLRTRGQEAEAAEELRRARELNARTTSSR